MVVTACLQQEVLSPAACLLEDLMLLKNVADLFMGSCSEQPSDPPNHECLWDA